MIHQTVADGRGTETPRTRRRCPQSCNAGSATMGAHCSVARIQSQITAPNIIRDWAAALSYQWDLSPAETHRRTGKVGTTVDLSVYHLLRCKIHGEEQEPTLAPIWANIGANKSKFPARSFLSEGFALSCGVCAELGKKHTMTTMVTFIEKMCISC